MNVVYSEKEIKDRVKSLGQQIAKKYGRDDVVLIGLMNGCFMFMADLARELYQYPFMTVTVDFIRTSHYDKHNKPTNEVEIGELPHTDLDGKTVILVDDIMETGNSLCRTDTAIRENFRPETIVRCVLVDKSGFAPVGGPPEFFGFVVGDKWLVGYGMDNGGNHRHLPFLGEES